ncbi:MAG: hypothetical protein AB1568_17510, partial [Thermodesulfobacteriota bacterium]
MTDTSSPSETGKDRDGGFGMISLYIGIGAFAVAMAFGFQANSARVKAEQEAATMREEASRATAALARISEEKATLGQALADAVNKKQTVEKQLEVATSWYGSLLDSGRNLTEAAFSTRLALEEQLTAIGRLPEQLRQRQDIRDLEQALSSLAVRLDTSFAANKAGAQPEPAGGTAPAAGDAAAAAAVPPVGETTEAAATPETTPQE